MNAILDELDFIFSSLWAWAVAIGVVVAIALGLVLFFNAAAGL